MSQCSMKLVEDPHGLPWLSHVLFPTAVALGSSAIIKKFWGKIAVCLFTFLWGRCRLGSKQFCGRSPQGSPKFFPQSFYPTVSLNAPPRFPHAFANIYIYIHTHTHVRTYIHTYLPTYLRKYVRTYKWKICKAKYKEENTYR